MKKRLINFKVDQGDYNMIEELRIKYHINISSLIRDLLVEHYKKIKHEKNM